MKKILNQALDLVLSFICLALAVLIVFGVITSRVSSDDIATSLVVLAILMVEREISRIRLALEQLAKAAG